MKLAAAVLVIAVTAAADPCPARLVFDTPAGNLPQLAWDGAHYQLVGYGKSELTLTTFAFGRTPSTISLGAGSLPATATNGTDLAIAYVADGAILPGVNSDRNVFIEIAGRQVYAPRDRRSQSFFTVVDRAGKAIVKPIALGDQRVAHTAPGVAVAWNPHDREWGVLWSEFNALQFARVTSAGKVVGQTPVAIDGFVDASSRMAWTGSAFAVLVRLPAKHAIALYEIDARGAHATAIPSEREPIEPVLAWSGSAFALAYRTSKPGAPPQHAQIATDRPVAPSRPQIEVQIPDSHDLWFRTITAGVVSAPVAIASASGGPWFDTPVIAADGAQLVLAWGRNDRGAGFDDRLFVARVDATGKLAAGYPKRLDDERVHEGYASIAGTGCDLAISYILGDPNQAVRIAVVRAP